MRILLVLSAFFVVVAWPIIVDSLDAAKVSSHRRRHAVYAETDNVSDDDATETSGGARDLTDSGPGEINMGRSAASIEQAERTNQNSIARPSTLSNEAPSEAAPPGGVTVHVVLRYKRGDETARKRALALEATLKADGLDVTEGPEAVAMKPDGGRRVTYFYENDQSLAKGLAERLAASAPLKGPLSADQPPRPGTIAIVE